MNFLYRVDFLKIRFFLFCIKEVSIIFPTKKGQRQEKLLRTRAALPATKRNGKKRLEGYWKSAWKREKLC